MFLSKNSTQVWKPLPLPIQLVGKAVFSVAKRRESEAGHLAQSSAEGENECSCSALPHMPYWRAQGQLYHNLRLLFMYVTDILPLTLNEPVDRVSRWLCERSSLSRAGSASSAVVGTICNLLLGNPRACSGPANPENASSETWCISPEDTTRPWRMTPSRSSSGKTLTFWTVQSSSDTAAGGIRPRRAPAIICGPTRMFTCTNPRLTSLALNASSSNIKLTRQKENTTEWIKFGVFCSL